MSAAQRIDLLVLPRWLIPVEPAGQALERYALSVQGGRILDVLPAAQAEKMYRPDERLELPRHAVMPGLVNAHTHGAMSLLRGVADDLPLMQWLQEHIWPAEAAHVSARFCEDGVALACLEFIRSGVTCFNDMYFFPDATATVAARAGLRASVGLIVLDFPSAWAQPGEYVHKGLELHDRLKDEPLIRTMFAPHAPYTVSDGPLREVRKYATELQIPIHMHVHETAFEVENAAQSTGKRPWQRLKELDLLGPDLMAVHMTQLTDAEIAECAQYGVHVVHCPESNLKLASGFCPVARLLSAGVNVALGTDGAASNNDLDLFSELRTAALLAKAVAKDAAAVKAHEALHMATLAGARALGMEQEIGSLVPGKAADFVAVDLSSVNSRPLYNPISQLVYAANSRQVTDVFVHGRPLLRDGRVLSLDESEVLARADEWRDQVCAP